MFSGESQIRHALDDGERLLVARREAAAEAVEQPVALDLAESVAQTVAEAVGPVAAHLDESALELGLLRLVEGADPLADRHPHDELQP